MQTGNCSGGMATRTNRRDGGKSEAVELKSEKDFLREGARTFFWVVVVLS